MQKEKGTKGNKNPVKLRLTDKFKGIISPDEFGMVL